MPARRCGALSSTRIPARLVGCISGVGVGLRGERAFGVYARVRDTCKYRHNALRSHKKSEPPKKKLSTSKSNQLPALVNRLTYMKHRPATVIAPAEVPSATTRVMSTDKRSLFSWSHASAVRASDTASVQRVSPVCADVACNRLNHGYELNIYTWKHTPRD